MTSNQKPTFTLAFLSASLGLLAAAPAQAASLQMVSNWGASGVPSYMQMYIYVPDKLATKPPIMVSSHACGSTATGQIDNIKTIKKAADANGFILILPDNSGNNCWDVGTTKSLKHDGGGDTQGVVQMVKYALTKYNGDASRVYAMGGSSGAMLTQALMAVYPDVFRAGSARAGVPAGCWADGYASSNQWSNTCAAGSVTKTAMQWGDLARGMFAGYTGHRPRVQIMQGMSDTTISYKNFAEGIKQWTNVLGLSATATATDMFKGTVTTYNRQSWKNACGFTIFEASAGPGTHSMAYEEEAILAFFGLDKAEGADPETDCSGSGAGGTSGGVGGAGGHGSAAGGTNGGVAGNSGTQGSGGSSSGSGGSSSGSGGSGTGGSDSGTGGSGSGGTGSGGQGSGGSGSGGQGSGGSGSGGLVGSGGSGSGGQGSGDSNGNGSGGSTNNDGGGSGSGGSTGENNGAGGCTYVAGSHGGTLSSLATLLLVGLGLVVRRQRRTRR